MYGSIYMSLALINVPRVGNSPPPHKRLTDTAIIRKTCRAVTCVCARCSRAFREVRRVARKGDKQRKMKIRGRLLFFFHFSLSSTPLTGMESNKYDFILFGSSEGAARSRGDNTTTEHALPLPKYC